MRLARLFAAVFICLTGNGLLNTLLSTRMAVEGFSTAATGIVLSCYFTGLLSGSFLCHHLIQRVGHIRAFTIFVAVTTAAALLHGLYLSPLFWGALRFLCGIATFGMFMVIESWLNECTESHNRGSVFSIYMTLSYLGIGIGQQLLNIGDVTGHESLYHRGHPLCPGPGAGIGNRRGSPAEYPNGRPSVSSPSSVNRRWACWAAWPQA